MKNYLLAILVAVLGVLACPLSGQFGGGTGTIEDPYLIANAAHLNSIREYPDAYFSQINNIDMGEYGDLYWVSSPFNGNYNGNNYTISRLYINTGINVFFGLFHGSGHLSNIRLTEINYTGIKMGGLMGWMSDGSLINCHVSGNMYPSSSSSIMAGGLVGEIRGTVLIENCQTSVNITGVTYGAGLVALMLPTNTSATIRNCHTSGTIEAMSASGLIFIAYNTRIINCSSTGTFIISGAGMGLLGSGHFVEIINSHRSGSILGDPDTPAQALSVIGLATNIYGGRIINSSANLSFGSNNYYAGNGYGLVEYFSDYSSIIGQSYPENVIQGCYSSGTLYGYQMAGFIGKVKVFNNPISIENCYCRTNIFKYNDGFHAGGMFIYLEIDHQSTSVISINNCYYGGTVSGDPEYLALFAMYFDGSNVVTGTYYRSHPNYNAVIYGGTPTLYGRTMLQMTYPYSYDTYEGWDFNNVWVEDQQWVNGGFPYLRDNGVPVTVDPVYLSHASGYYPQPFHLSMLTNTVGAQIYYTIDGSTPTEQSIMYTEPVLISVTTTVKARAFKLNNPPSLVTQAYYVLHTEEQDQTQVPIKPDLAIYPNPSKDQTMISYKIGSRMDVKLSIYNNRGQYIRTLVKDSKSSGEHTCFWDGNNAEGRPMPGGVYFVLLEEGRNRVLKKLVLLGK